MLPLNQIINDDCLEVINKFPDNCIDAVITDPPFGIGLEYNGVKENCDNPVDYWNWLKHIIRELERVIKEGGFIAIWQSNKYFKYMWDWFGADINIIIVAHNFSQIHSGAFRNSYDIVITKYKGKPILPEYRETSRDFFVADTATVIAKAKNNIERNHPCPRPLDAVEYLVKNFVVERGIVLDPFLGSGTTAVACEKLGRKWIGIEVDSDYCDLSKKRIKPWINQTRFSVFKEQKNYLG